MNILEEWVRRMLLKHAADFGEQRTSYVEAMLAQADYGVAAGDVAVFILDHRLMDASDAAEVVDFAGKSYFGLDSAALAGEARALGGRGE